MSNITLASEAQTTLVKGDIAFTGFIGNGTVAGNDQFSFVLLRDITTGTVINFTDNAWLRSSATSGSWRTGEGTVTWTSNAAYLKGTEIKIEVTGAATATATFVYLATSGGAGTAVGAVMPSFSANGDQIIAYQGAIATPTFICAIHFNSYNAGIVGEPITNTTDWEGAYSTANSCGLPALTSVSANNFLTNGVNAFWVFNNPIVEFDNARFNCSGTMTTVGGIRAAIYVTANWSASYDDDAPSFSIPTGCFLLSPVPVKLIGFQAQNNLTNIITKWQVTNEINVSHYEVERSFDGKNFERIGTVAVQAGNENKNYNYTDPENLKNLAAIIYYRLKSVDADGKFSYSDIVTVRNNKDESILVDNFANPINDNLNFNLTVKTKGIVIIQITDVNGKIAISKQLQVNAGRSSISLPEAATLSKGIYFLRVTTSTASMVTKLIK